MATLGPPSPYNQMPNSPGRPHTSEGRRPTFPPPGSPMHQSPRSPHPRDPNQWPERSQTPPAGRSSGPPPLAGGRPPNAPRYPGNIPPRQESYNYPPGPRPGGPPDVTSREDPGYGQRSPPVDGNSGPDKHYSTATSSGSMITTNEIIEHYAHGPYHGPSSTSDRPSMDKPRAGVLKTVGGADPETTNQPNFDIPSIDFGPTLNYANTSPRNKNQAHGGPDPLHQAPRPYSPAGQVPNHPGRKSPGARPEHGRGGSTESSKRTLAWQPGGTAAGMGSQGLSAEQYVQQRAAAAQPQYSHARTPSGNIMAGRSETPSPSVKRRSSYDMLHHRHSRSLSGDLLQRPNSQSGNTVLDWSGSGNASSHLSAREQEQMARMTGAPLVNVGAQPRGPSPGPGLVGTIDARERERQQVRQGANSQAAQYVMNQRQQPQAPMAYGQAYSPPMVVDGSMSPQPAYHAMSHAPGPYSGPQAGQYGPSSPMGPPSSFSRPLRAGTQSPQLGDPRLPPPQRQYSHSPGGGRNLNPNYQGHAF